MGAWTRLKQIRWYRWIILPLAAYGALELVGEGAKFYWSWQGYQYERGVAVTEGLVVPTFSKYRKAKNLQLDPVMGQLFGKRLCRAAEKAIADLLPSGEQAAARDTLSAFKAQVDLVGDADLMLIAERIDDLHLILKDPKHHTPDELRAWLGKVKDFAAMRATYKYQP
ncbi:MAG TPA: hypothetical protein VJ483_06460 [Holophagaceae bacterium]|nr:hypothetical protein [Holophagaceae bacterium]